jgi:cytochrome c peroxidase
MLRRLLVLAVAAAIGVAALGDDKPSPVPKDSLPATMPIDIIPLGLKNREAPKDNPLTEQRVQLGRKLFFDPILSIDHTVACASCHQPDHGFAGPGAKPRGIRGQGTTRKAPTLLNRAYGAAFFWDGRETTLEGQALRPIEDPAEMGSKLDEVVKQLQADKDYKERFEAAFTDGVTQANLGRALASFERVLLRGDSPVDRFRSKGEHAALTPGEREGLWLYESKAACWRCHAGSNFTDERFHNTGVGWGKEPPDLGRAGVTKRDEDRGKFKTPTLRGVVLTAPYMHDGSLATLEDVVEFYNRGGRTNPNLDPVIKPLDLSKDEIAALVAFLKCL